MRVMVLVKASDESESGGIPSTELLTEMGKFNEELVKAGIMLAGDGLRPSSAGKRVRFDGSDRTVIDGPFAETKELVAGYWIWEVASVEESVEWLKRAPFDGGAVVEIRPFSTPEDFGENFTPELREAEERLRAEAEQLGQQD
ncbi:MAG TPA: YciI family protein [Jatrophihabitantaceae bacterium]